MPWKLDEIESEWMGGERLPFSSHEVVRAFEVAEQFRGHEWVLSTTRMPGGGRQAGYEPFLRVYAFGTQMQAVDGAKNVDRLLERLLKDDRAAESELSAIHLLRSRRPQTEVEIEPDVMVGRRHRVPDFRIRSEPGPWTYVEVTQLNSSTPSLVFRTCAFES